MRFAALCDSAPHSQQTSCGRRWCATQCPQRTSAGTTTILVRASTCGHRLLRALAVLLPHTPPRALLLLTLIPDGDPPNLPTHCPGADPTKKTVGCARDFVIRAPDDDEGNGPAACGAACITTMGVTSTTGDFTIKVGLESGHQCYCGGVDTTVPPAYKSTLDQCSTTCSGGIIGTCNTATGVGCCGGTWLLNTVQVKCTGTPAPWVPTPSPYTPCVLAPGVEYTATPMRVLSNVGNAEACCDACKATRNCTAWTVRNGSTWTCSLYNAQFAAKASKAVLMSGHIVGAATHYQDPFTQACLPGELNLTVANLQGRWCSAACDKATACPLDVPANVTAKPSCEIHDPVGSGMHCALVCASDVECGPTNASVCDQTFSPGICAYAS